MSSMPSTYEYLDVRGAPWIIESVDGDKASRAISVMYKSTGLLTANSLDLIIEKIDAVTKKKDRDPVNFVGSRVYPGIKDGDGGDWSVNWVGETYEINEDGEVFNERQWGKGPAGFYASQPYGATVGPANTQKDLNKYLTKYLNRISGKSGFAVDGGSGPQPIKLTPDQQKQFDVAKEMPLKNKLIWWGLGGAAGYFIWKLLK